MNNTPTTPFMPAEPPVIPPVQANQPPRGHGGRSTLFVDPAPYPEVKNLGNDADNRATVKMLKDDYAGADGELTAITTYVFQNITSEDETFANAMLQIAIVEMTHLDMLGDAIETLGGNPSFDDGEYYWNASNVDYTRTRAEQLRNNIKSEQGAIESYRAHAAATQNPTVRDFLLRIARDEQLHFKFFERQLAEL